VPKATAGRTNVCFY